MAGARIAAKLGGVGWSRGAAVVLLALFLAGCTHVVTQTTPYYHEGPAQLAGPQGQLPEGTGVWVIGREGDYARVLTLGGVHAYVWNGALRSAWQGAAAEKPTAERKAE